MSTPNTPSEGPASGGPPAEGPNADRARAKGPNQTAGEVAGRSADAARSEQARSEQARSEQARSEQARTMRDRVSQQEAAAAEAVTKERPAAQRPSSAPKGPVPQRGTAGPAAGAPRPPLQRTQRPVVTGTAAPRGQQGTPVPSTAPDSRAPKPNAASDKVTVPKVTAPKAPDPTAAETADVVDAPTSHISRSKVPTTGMQDLSTVQHPSTAAADAGREHQEARPRPVVSVGSRRGRGPLRASMQLRSIDPWSTLKISLLLSVALFFVWLVAVGIIYLVLDGMGVWDRLNTGVVDIMSNSDSVPTLIGPGQVFGVAAIIGIINVVLFTAMTTIGAFVYNISAEAVGGVEVTLADRD